MAAPCGYVILASQQFAAAARLAAALIVLAVFLWWLQAFVRPSTGTRRTAALMGSLAGVALLLIAAAAMAIGR